MLSVCDSIREGSISDVSKSYFLKEFTPWKKKEYFIDSNSFVHGIVL